MKKPEPYSWEELEVRRARQRKEVNARRETLQAKLDKLFAPETVDDSPVDRLVYYSKTAFSLYDGFMTGFKLLRKMGLRSGRKKK